MERSITNMIQLEHQAEMNYYAYAVAGKDHPYVPSKMVLEGSSGSQWELPHFKQAIAQAGMPLYGGVWQAWYEDAAASI
jgi:hypothetical protein